MTDIPTHLIEAYFDSGGSASPVLAIERVLAALRPEDAHLVPVWKDSEERWVNSIRGLGDGFQKELDEARAEIERLKADRRKFYTHMDEGRA